MSHSGTMPRQGRRTAGAWWSGKQRDDVSGGVAVGWFMWKGAHQAGQGYFTLAVDGAELIVQVPVGPT